MVLGWKVVVLHISCMLMMYSLQVKANNFTKRQMDDDDHSLSGSNDPFPDSLGQWHENDWLTHNLSPHPKRLRTPRVPYKVFKKDAKGLQGVLKRKIQAGKQCYSATFWFKWVEASDQSMTEETCSKLCVGVITVHRYSAFKGLFHLNNLCMSASEICVSKPEGTVLESCADARNGQVSTCQCQVEVLAYNIFDAIPGSSSRRNQNKPLAEILTPHSCDPDGFLAWLKAKIPWRRERELDAGVMVKERGMACKRLLNFEGTGIDWTFPTEGCWKPESDEEDDDQQEEQDSTASEWQGYDAEIADAIMDGSDAEHDDL